MKRQRTVTILLAAACLFMAGVTLHQFHVPLGSPVAAQNNSPTNGPMPFGLKGMRPASPAIRKAAVAAITAQLQAFQKDDYAAAVKFQSSNLRRNFTSVTRFRQMIMTGYPEFAHYKSVQFKDVQADTDGRHAMVQVMLIGQDGVTINALYLMVREATGYKIDGVAGGGRMPLPAAPGHGFDA